MIQNEASPEPLAALPGSWHVYVEGKREGAFLTVGVALEWLRGVGILTSGGVV